ncbi:MAG: glycosyltransferase family 4 protein [Acidobacteria bacterium]|nr:MAG: glycosyltransferase family 4 protein [Acidobacteriota bacterium]REK08691.1 MAG: glycosyltransferase family 4 protein [Acidobacteriota bacterium]
MRPQGVDRRPARVALVHDWLTGMRGGEKVLEQIADLFPKAPIHTLFHFPGSVSPALESHPIRVSRLQRIPRLRRHYRSFLPLFPGAIERFDFSDFDLVVSTSHCVAKGARAPNGVHLCYCHTPVRYAWDQRDAYFPDDGPLIGWLRGRLLDRLQRWDRTSADRVDAYAANSHFVRRRIERFWRRSATVVHPPVDVEALGAAAAAQGREDRRDREPYLLSVAALSPYKRHDLAIAAARRLGRRLVVVGEGPQRRELEHLAGGDGRIELVGRVSTERLQALLIGAEAFVQPGIEDFGIAAVEALAAGTPVVAAADGGVLDIVVDGEHGFLYDPGDGLEGLLGALGRAAGASLPVACLRQQASRFSRERFRSAFVAFLERSLQADLFRRLELYG